MTDAEQFEAYGRAMTELKQAKFTLAALAVNLSNHVRRMREAADLVERFIRSPLAQAPDQILLSEHAKGVVQRADVVALIDELVSTVKRVAELQKLVDGFEK